MITIKAQLFSSEKDRLFGQIGFTKPRPILFLTRFGIHTFGLKFPIDVVILDEKNVVVKIKEDLKPGHFFFWSPKYAKVLELPVRFVKENKIKIGSKINLEIKS